jgi:hypothetical protein
VVAAAPSDPAVREPRGREEMRRPSTLATGAPLMPPTLPVGIRPSDDGGGKGGGVSHSGESETWKLRACSSSAARWGGGSKGEGGNNVEWVGKARCECVR